MTAKNQTATPKPPLSPVERNPDGRLHAPAVQRNAVPIADVLAGLLRPGATVLEIASGTGEHAALLAARFPDVNWQPSEIDPERLASIEAWRMFAGAPRLQRPIELDAASTWPISDNSVDLVLAINLLHMLPEGAIEDFLGEARRVLAPHGCVALYAPLRDGDEYFSSGNKAFDDSLRQSHPSLGLRDMCVIAAQALRQGLHLEQRIAMPANNHFLVLRAGAISPTSA